MVVIELEFPAGRYHATPWGRNVNEGDVEWPPSPYRLARALVDVWKRKRSHWHIERVLPILESLASPPLFFLPPAGTAHTRSYLSSNQKDPDAKQLIFDAFVVLEKGTKVRMGLENHLSGKSLADFQELLRELNFLGRSESWVKAAIGIDAAGMQWNCLPASESVEGNGKETVRVACLNPPARAGHQDQSLGQSWIGDICMTTKKLLSEGWSHPPALKWVDYCREARALRPFIRPKPVPFRKKFTCAKYALQSPVLPRIQGTLPFAEKVRAFLMGIHRRVQGGNPSNVSPTFSGKAVNGKPMKGHAHAFYLPLDEDADGRIDHILVKTETPFSESELMALDRFDTLWQSKGRPDIRLVLVSLSSSIDAYRAKTWINATPFVTARHYRKGRGTYGQWLESEIQKECTFHGLPNPARIQWIPHTLTTPQPIRWMEFIRSRKNKMPPKGHGCMLEFDEPTQGPFALGSECHFGLGLFVPFEGKDREP